MVARTKSFHATDKLDVKDFVRAARRRGQFVLDLETIGRNKKEALDPHRGRIQGIALKAGDAKAFYEVSPFGPHSLTKVVRRLQPLLADTDVTMVGHNLKFDIQWLWKLGAEVKVKLYDTMIASYLLNEDRKALQVVKGEGASKYGLKKLVYEHFGHKMTAYSEQEGSLFDKKLAEYALDDVEWTDRLASYYEADLKDEDLIPVFEKIEMPLVYILADMELTGVFIDPKRLRVVRDKLIKRRKQIEREIFKMVGHAFDIGKDHHVAGILYDEGFYPDKVQARRITLPMDDDERPVPIGKSGVPSTKKEVLELFEMDFPFVRKLLEWRHCSVLLNTFCHKLIRTAETSADGRVHGSFNQTGTKIGRLSSSGPNLQNIPRPEGKGDDYHDSIRGAFMAGPGNMFVGADLSQIELRMMAHWSGDPIMTEVYSSKGTCRHGKRGCESFRKQVKDKAPEIRCPHIDIHTATSEALRVPRSPIAKCLDYSTIVITQDGPRAIGSLFPEQCPIGDHFAMDGLYVDDARGGMVQASYGIKRLNRPTKIVVTRRGIVVCTEDHKFPVIGQREEGKKLRKHFDPDRAKKPMLLVQAQHMKPGMLLPPAVLPTEEKWHDEFQQSYHPITIPVNPFKKTVGVDGKASLALDCDFAYFAGLFAGDGTINENACAITHGGDDVKNDPEVYVEWRRQVREAVEAIGMPASTNSCGKETRAGSRVISRYMEALELVDLNAKDGRGGRRRYRIPSWVLGGGNKVIWSYLAGLFDTDGSCRKKTPSSPSFCTAHPEFAAQLAAVLRYLGIPISVMPSWNKDYKKYYYTIYVNAIGAAPFLRYCPIRRRDKRKAARRYLKTVKRLQRFTYDEVLFVLDGGRRDVYDFHVENEDHLYLQGGLVSSNNINFGACYRIGPRRLMSYAKISNVEDARRFLDGWYDTYDSVVQFHKLTEADLKANGWQTWTITGRKRRLLQESKINDFRAVTQGIQFRISGSSQDLLKIGMRNLWNEIQERKAEDPLWRQVHFILQVHDELGAEAPEPIAAEVLNRMKYHMETADGGHLAVPLSSSGGFGKRWTDAH